MAILNLTLSSNLSTVLAVGDPDGARAVMSLVGILVAVGIALLMIAVWMFKTTRPDAELLAPLELMGDRAWRRGDPVWQRRRLDEVRPPGARPLTRTSAPPVLDEEYESGPKALGFDDFEPSDALVMEGPLGADDVVSETVASTPVGISRVDLDIELDDGGDGELEPETLAAAMAELDAQLGERATDDA